MLGSSMHKIAQRGHPLPSKFLELVGDHHTNSLAQVLISVSKMGYSRCSPKFDGLSVVIAILRSMFGQFRGSLSFLSGKHPAIFGQTNLHPRRISPKLLQERHHSGLGHGGSQASVLELWNLRAPFCWLGGVRLSPVSWCLSFVE